MDCSWIKIYDAPINGKLLDPNTLYSNEIIYVDISKLPEEYEFIAWKDLQGNILDDSIIEKVDDGWYKTSVSCGGGFVAYVKTKEEKICLVVVECDTNRGIVQRGEKYNMCNETTTITAIPKCCYEFEKWSDADPVENLKPERNITVLQGVNTYTATFIEKQFPISVSVNDDTLGTATISPNTVKCGESFTLTATPSNNCVFDSWKPGGYTESTLTIEYKCNDPRSYVAYFSKIPRYTITYHYNSPDGQDIKIVDEFYKNDEFVYRTISDSNYIFCGWSFDPELQICPEDEGCDCVEIKPNTPGTFDYPDSIDLYGVWKAKIEYTLRYFGTPIEPDAPWGEEYSVESYEGDLVTLMRPNAQEGYDFKGWIVVNKDEEPDRTKQAITGQIPMKEGGLDAYSVWTNDTTYTLEYFINDGIGTVVYINNITQGQELKVKSPNELGFNFTCIIFEAWTGSDGNRYTPGDAITITQKRTTLSANWIEDKVRLDYDTSSADSGVVASVTECKGSEVILNDGRDISKTGYTFGGWSTFGGTPLNSPITLNSNLIVYPIWNKIPEYTVKYITNTCDPISDTEKYEKGGTVMVQECKCTSETGCNCIGWIDQNGEKHLNSTSFTITQNMVLTEYFGCCVTFLTNEETAVLTIKGETIEWGKSANIDDDFVFDVTVEEGCCFEGWFDVDSGLFIYPCADETISGYTYKLIPGAYVKFINNDNVKFFNDTGFITQINERHETYNDKPIICNRDTGEYRQVIPNCENEAYSLPCGRTVVAVINCGMFQETIEPGPDYHTYEGNFDTLYDFLNEREGEEEFFEHNLVRIKGVPRYFDYSKCNNEQN